MRKRLLAILFLLSAGPALAQQPFSPLSGPNTPVPSPICELVNFGFCPQPPVPPPPLPDPNADAAAYRAAPPAPPPPAQRRRPVRHHRQADEG